MAGNDDTAPVAPDSPPHGQQQQQQQGSVWSPASAKALRLGNEEEEEGDEQQQQQHGSFPLLPPLPLESWDTLLRTSLPIDAAICSSSSSGNPAFAFGEAAVVAGDMAALTFQSPSKAVLASSSGSNEAWEATFDLSALETFLPHLSEPGVRCTGPRDYRLRLRPPMPRKQQGGGKGQQRTTGGGRGGLVHRPPGQEEGQGEGYAAMPRCCDGHHGHEHQHSQEMKEAMDEEDDQVYRERVSDATAALLQRATQRRARQLFGGEESDSEDSDHEQSDGEDAAAAEQWVDAELSKLKHSSRAVRTVESLEAELLAALGPEERQALQLALDDETIREGACVAALACGSPVGLRLGLI